MDLLSKKGVVPKFDVKGTLQSIAAISDDGEHIPAIISQVRENADCFDAACIRASYLIEQGVSLPLPLASFAAGVLAGRIERPKDKSGKKAPNNYSIRLSVTLLS